VGGTARRSGSTPTPRARRFVRRWRGSTESPTARVCIGERLGRHFESPGALLLWPRRGRGRSRLQATRSTPCLSASRTARSRRFPSTGPWCCRREDRGSGARVFFLTSPNAPTGVGFPKFGDRPDPRVLPASSCVDEAYAPFARENAAGLLGAHPNLVVVRTLSKAFALAGSAWPTPSPIPR